MRRTNPSLHALASVLLTAVALAGCQQSATRSASGSEVAKGVAGKYYYVNLFVPPVGGYVTSSSGGISCGAASVAVNSTVSPPQYGYTYFSTAAGPTDHCGQTRFEWGQSVTLTATPQGGAFLGWGGDCSGASTCTITAGADRTVVAIFGTANGGHPNFTNPLTHGPAYIAAATGQSTLVCSRCHGSTLDGRGIAPSCNACHAANGAPSWQTKCDFCHGVPPSATHLYQGTDLTRCAACHWASINPDGTFVAGGKHLDGVVQGAGHPPGYAARERHGADALATQVTDCQACHGQDYGSGIGASCNACHAAAGWADWKTNCSFCHGLRNATTMAGYSFAAHPEWAAPPDDLPGRLTGTNGPAVGAHQAHVAANDIRAPIGCAECHTVPATAIHTLNHALDLPFGPLSRSAGAAPTWDSATLTCASNYCHGNFSYGGVQGKAASLTWNSTLIGCTTCHEMPPAGHLPVGHTAASCSGCHPDTVLPSGAIDLAKGRHINGQKDMTGGACDSCHWFPYPSAVPPAVPFAATGAHLAHYGLTAGQGSTGYGDLQTLEAKFPSGSPTTTRYAFGCGNCHPIDGAQHSMLGGSTTAKVVLFEAAAPGGSLKAKNAPTAVFDAGTKTCSGVYCHGNVAATPAWTGGALACNGCHGTGTANGRPDYPSGSPKANSHAAHDFACGTCHQGTTVTGTSVASTVLHVNGADDVSPGPGVTFTYAYAPTGGTCSNVSCHGGGSATWGPVESHLAALGSGDVVVFTPDSNHDVTPLSITENCTLCHAPSLVTQHASRCDLCHQGANPAAPLIGAWTKTCTASGCHAAVHSGGPARNHDGMYDGSSASCDRCHDTSTGDFPGPGDNCTRCHDPSYTAAAVGDHQAPTTTSNAVANYVGGASIHLTATDAGTSGVSLTWYLLDGLHGWVLGSDVSVSAPVTGSRAHTLQFYSVDHARNAEAVKTVGFTVQAVADTVAPVTTSSFTPAAGAIYRTSQAVALSATDNASGVKATYYAIDAGAFVQGTSFNVTDGLHTFRWYSVDNANNTEATHTSNQFRVDTVAPVTASTAVNGQTYTGNQTFTLTAADTGGSGVASTWYRLDAGALTAGTSIAVAAPASGSASHTMTWYSLDVVGNQEAAKTATFTVQAAVTDTTAPVTTSSFNPAAGASYKAAQAVTLTATDNPGGTGVKTTSYRIDGGTLLPGTSFTVTGDGLHTFSWYSVDNANNTETTHTSNQFRIDTVAPVTTSSAVAGTTYTGSQTVTLTATDPGGSGVASTWYRLDGGTLTSGTSIPVAAPASGSASHTITWYSIDAATNQEATKSVTFTVQAAVGPPPTITLTFKSNWTFANKSGWDYIYWEIQDASGQALDSYYDDSTSVAAKTWVVTVPAGAAYIMYGAYGPAPDGPDLETATNPVSAAQATPGAAYTWTWQ